MKAIFLNATESRTQNFKREFERRGWVIEEFYCLNWGAAIRELSTYIRALQSCRVVLTGTGFPYQIPLVLLALLYRRTIVVDCPMDITVWPFPEAWHWKKIVGFFFRKSDCFVTISSRDYLIEKFTLDRNKVLFIESCPDLELIARGLTASAKFTRPEGKFVIGYSGIALSQRIDRFVPVFKALRDRFSNITWLIVSDANNSMIQSLLDRATEQGVIDSIHFLPVIKPVEDFYATIAQCDLWIGHLGNDTVLGTHELRMELLEIGAMGKPVVFVQTPALEKHGFVDGDNIIIINPWEPEASAEKLLHYINSREKLLTLGQNLQELVLKKFQLSVSVDRLLAFVDNYALGEKR